MNLSLYRSMLKIHSKVLISYVLGVFSYLILVILTFPLFAESKELHDAIAMLPESILVAFGIQGSLSNINDYMAMNFFNSLYLYVLMAYTILTAIHFIARLVDRGSMVYLLSTPVSRIKIVTSQICVLVTGLIIVSLSSVLAGVLGVNLFVSEATFDMMVFLQINSIVFLIFLVVSAYSFLISCTVGEEKQAMGLGFGITLLFYAIDMGSKLTSELSWLGYFTLFSLYRPQDIAQGDYNMIPVSISLLLLSFVLFAISAIVFKNRNLSI